MATWVIGDVQGCMSTLERLLERIALDPAKDRVWLVGDLVNRGPRSVDVLRWAKGLGDAAVCVLGNHDLHLLSRAVGAAEEKKRDTLDDVLRAPDRDELIDWLRTRPLAHVEDGRILVHGGLSPRWSAKKVRKLAAEVEAGLRGDDWKACVAELAGKESPRPWDDDLEGAARLRTILAFFVRARCLDEHGAPEPDFKAHPRQAKKGLVPWFEVPGAAWTDHIVYFGHWAALGLSIGNHQVGLDTGCVWGKHLTAFRLDDELVVQVKAVEARG